MRYQLCNGVRLTILFSQTYTTAFHWCTVEISKSCTSTPNQDPKFKWQTMPCRVFHIKFDSRVKIFLISTGQQWLNIHCEKHAYSNILKILQPKKENFQIKNSDIFHIYAQHIDCGYSLETPRRGGSNEYSQSMFFSKIKNKIM